LKQETQAVAKVINRHTTHTKEVISGERLEQALKTVADWYRDNARDVFLSPDWGAHVSYAQKQTWLAERIEYAYQVEAGTARPSFALWQRVNTHLTGTCVAPTVAGEASSR
jgi:hypothetical protein